MSEMPPECESIAAELKDLQDRLVEASWALDQDFPNKADAHGLVIGLMELIQEKRRELDKCMGCKDPVDVAVETTHFGFEIRTSDPRFAFGQANLPSAWNDPGMRALAFKFTGCYHETLLPRPGWRALVSSPFINPITVTVPRRFPDVLSGFPPTLPPTLALRPYLIRLVPTAVISVVGTGRYERATGHLDLPCELRINWNPLGGPPPFWNFLYQLDFGPSTFRGIFTTRDVSHPLMGNTGGNVLNIPNLYLRLVSGGTLTGGFANGTAIFITIDGQIQPGPGPVGP